MTLIINQSDVIGASIIGLNDITGTFFVSLLIVFILVIAISFIFRIPIEWTTLFILPLGLGFSVATANFLPITIVVLIFAGVLLAKHFIFGN